MDKLLTDMVMAIVDKPDEVSVKVTESENTKIYELSVGDGDLGKVFGKKVYTDEIGFRVVKKYQRIINDKLDKVFFIGGSVTFGSGSGKPES